mmetsp:Transcript_105146/g.327807  ORF Transcript_105146/g.327807 Transcript_105146/m.327807 type:complete len:562 (+) Transcript_105146:93-1778(+)
MHRYDKPRAVWLTACWQRSTTRLMNSVFCNRRSINSANSAEWERERLMLRARLAREAELEHERSVRQEMEAFLQALALLTKAHVAQWQWGSGGSYFAFNPAENYQVEKAFSERRSGMSVQCGRYSYDIDFSMMQQTNVKTGTRRPIRRVVALRGFADAHEDIVRPIQAALVARIQEAISAQGDRDIAQASLEKVRADLDAARVQVEETQGDRDAARADLEEVRVDRDVARAQLEKAQDDRDAARAQLDALQVQFQAHRMVVESFAASEVRLKAKVRDSQIEMEGLRTELEQLAEYVAQLEAKAALAAKTHRKVLDSLSFWRWPAEPLQVKLLAEPSMIDAARNWFHSLSHLAVQHGGVHSKCTDLQKVLLLSVEYVHNPYLWRGYCHSKDELKQVHKSEGIVVHELSPPAPSLKDVVHGGDLPPLGPQLDASLNEVFLFHGCSEVAAASIMRSGFDTRCAREKDFYGEGIYFASQPCKAMQYAKNDGTKCMFVARVLLGDPAYLKDKTTGKLPPERADKPGARYDSSVVNPKDSHIGQIHREFVIFDSSRVYPELLIKYLI